MTEETREWAERPRVEDTPEEPEVQAADTNPAAAEASSPPGKSPPVLDEQTLALLQRPLRAERPRTWFRPRLARRNAASVKRLAAAFKALQDGLWSLAQNADLDAGLLGRHIRALASDQEQIETALREGRVDDAWEVCNAAWLRFARIVPLEDLDLLLSLKIHGAHASGTGTQTLLGYFEALREGAALLAHNPEVDREQLRTYALILEETRPKIEQALAARQFDHAWFLVRGLWELRLGILPAEQLEAERQALELLVRSVGSSTHRKKLEDALKAAKGESDIPHLRSILVWIKREINESAQVRYWKFNIYERRIKLTVSVMLGFVVALAVMAISVRVLQQNVWDWDIWLYQSLVVLSVLIAGGLCGAVSQLHSSEEISQTRISAAYFKQAESHLRMLVGAAAGLVVYLILASGLVGITFSSTTLEWVYLPICFLAGFSEQFFLQALEKVERIMKAATTESPPSPTAISEPPAPVAPAPGKGES
jgi:hypothetical protein